MNKAALALISILLAGCSMPYLPTGSVTPTLNSVSAQATLAHAGSDVQAVSAQETRTAENAVATLNAKSINATATAQALSASTNNEISAVMIEQAKAGATATRTAISATVQAINRQVALDSVSALSNTQAITTAAALKIERTQRERDKENDWLWSLPEYAMKYAPCVSVFLLIGLVWAFLRGISRAIVARAAGSDKRAEMALSPVGFPIFLPALPSPAVVSEDDLEIDGETGNTVTQGNTGNSAVTQENTDDFMLVDRGNAPSMPRMTSEERSEFQAARHDAIALLARCVDYYKQAGEIDNGTIPRYDKLKMKPEYRGTIVDNLEYSGLASKTKNRSAVVPEIGTCAALMKLIVDNRKRVYPVGYHERKQALLDSAVNALPSAGLQ